MCHFDSWVCSSCSWAYLHRKRDSLSLVSPETVKSHTLGFSSGVQALLPGGVWWAARTYLALPVKASQRPLSKGQRTYGPFLERPGYVFHELLLVRRRWLSGWNVEFQVNKTLAKSTENSAIVLCSWNSVSWNNHKSQSMWKHIPIKHFRAGWGKWASKPKVGVGGHATCSLVASNPSLSSFLPTELCLLISFLSPVGFMVSSL